MSAGRELPVIFVTASALLTELDELVLLFYLPGGTALACRETSGIPAVPIIFGFVVVAEFGAF